MRSSSIAAATLLLLLPVSAVAAVGASGRPAAPDDYFQQAVAYEIEVTLDDWLHTLQGRERLRYRNESPDTLAFIWFHLWPNAYRDDSSAFARQMLELDDTSFHDAPADERGGIDGLAFTVDGEPALLEPHPRWNDVGRLLLPRPLPPGGEVEIATPFTVELPRVFSRLGHSGRHYEITQWYPKPAVYDHEGWHPMPYLNMGEFYSEIGSFDVRITLPREYRLMATGDLLDGAAEIAWLDSLAAEGAELCALEGEAFERAVEELQDAAEAREEEIESGEGAERPLKTLHFHQDRVHDFALFADPAWIVRRGELQLPKSGRRVTLWSFFLPRNAERWRDSLTYLHRAGEFYSDFTGEYPYDHITAVDGDMSAGGGMEYPNITVISQAGSDDVLEMVIEHEVGHNWFYGVLASNERDHPWLDEGLNDYTDLLYWERYHPDGVFIFNERTQRKLGLMRDLRFAWAMSYLGYAQQAIRGDDQPLDLASEEFDPSNYGAMVYGKTGVMMRYLHAYLGAEEMRAIFHDYFRRWGFRHPGPADFEALVADHAPPGDDLSWFFDGCIHGRKTIDAALAGVTRSAGGAAGGAAGVEVGDRVRLENRGSLAGPVEVGFFDGEREEIERHWLPPFSGAVALRMPAAAKRVVVDPDRHMPDLCRANDASSRPWRLRFLLGQPDLRAREFFWFPWIGGNRYNGVTPGLGLYGGRIPPHSGGISVVPQWDLRHDRVVGRVNAEQNLYRFERLPALRRLTLAAAGARTWDVWAGRVALRSEWGAPVQRRRRSVASVEWGSTEIGGGGAEGAGAGPFYDPGRYFVARASVGHWRRISAFSRFRVDAGAVLGRGDAEFLRAAAWGRWRWRYGSDWRSLRLRGWIGGFLDDGQIPTQYRTWMAGGVDPDFASAWVFDRSGVSSVWGLGRRLFVADAGPGMRGYLPLASSEMAWGVNLDQNLPLPYLGFLDLSLFADLAGASDLDAGPFADSGLLLAFGPVKLIAPLWESWEKQETPGDWQWLSDRFRFSLEVAFGPRDLL
jgi:hypothetical protein